MNKTEFLALSTEKIYSFNFYYGETKTGIIIFTNDIYVFIKPININVYNDSQTDFNSLIETGILEPINIETIINWNPIK